MKKDSIHDEVRESLEKDGWTITADPYMIRFENVRLAADLAAEKTFAAERSGHKIVVEIKSFIGASPFQDLKLALGQYVLYLGYLEEVDPERQLYLAVTEKVYKDFLMRKEVEFIRKKYQVPMIIVDTNQKEIVKWIK